MTIWEWVDENKEFTPYLLAEMIPIHETVPQFHPIARKLLKKFPDDQKVKSLISVNWHSEAWVGHASSHYGRKLKIVKEWVTDPEEAVRTWAKKEFEYLNESISQSKIREAEENFY